MGRALAIDFGLKRCGLAVTDELKMIASGLDHIDSAQLDTYLADYFVKEEVDTIVLGYPVSMDGSDTHVTSNVRLLKKHLEEKYSAKEVLLIDERFTSSMASRSMLDMGMSKKKRKEKGMVDEISAVIILQTFLDRPR